MAQDNTGGAYVRPGMYVGAVGSRDTKPYTPSLLQGAVSRDLGPRFSHQMASSGPIGGSLERF